MSLYEHRLVILQLGNLSRSCGIEILTLLKVSLPSILAPGTEYSINYVGLKCKLLAILYSPARSKSEKAGPILFFKTFICLT